jgi:hypothetical protein
MYSTNKTDSHDITEILLKVALNTINLKPILLYSNYHTITATTTPYNRIKLFYNFIINIMTFMGLLSSVTSPD